MPKVITLSAAESTVTSDESSILPTSGEATITVTAKQADGTPFGRLLVSGNISVASTGTGNTITPISTVTNQFGEARFTFSSTVAQAKTISATVLGVAVTDTVVVTVAAAGALDAGSITATAGDEEVVIAQATAPSGGTAPYTRNLFRSTTNGVKGSELVAGVTLPYTDTTVTNDTAYYYTLEVDDNAAGTDDTAQVTATPSAIVWGFDPAANGLSNIVNRNFSTKAATDPDRGTGSFPDKTGGSEGWDGVESIYPKLTIASDATAPMSPNGVMQFEYTAGAVGAGVTYDPGVAQTLSFTGSTMGNRTDTEAYWRMAFKLSANWQQHPSGGSPKLMFWRSSGSPRVDNVLGLKPDADLNIIYNLQGSGLDGREQLDANVNIGSDIVVPDTWVRIELYTKMNTLGNGDGILRIWRDGTLILEYEDIEFQPTTTTQVYWDSYHLSPNWGGQGGTITNTMYMYMDAVYLWGKS
jgi:hypothetical protein